MTYRQEALALYCPGEIIVSHINLTWKPLKCFGKLSYMKMFSVDARRQALGSSNPQAKKLKPNQ